MNLNQRQTEYDLAGVQTEEVIRIYGIPIKLLLAERINKDIIFGDHSHIKVDDKNVFNLYALAENQEEFNDFEKLQTQFGIPGDDTINLWISKISLFNLLKRSTNSQNEIDITSAEDMIHKLFSSLIILPSGKILEITKIELDTPGLNNLFLFNKSKNVYKLFCKSYVHDTNNEISADTKITNEPVENPYSDSFESLEKYFDELTNITHKQNEIAKEFHDKVDPVFGRF